MEGDPFGVVEAMTIAGFATGCEQGFVYVRGEYPLAHERLPARHRRRPRARPARHRHPGPRLRLRHRDPAGRRGVHLRRRDRDLQFDRRLSRRAPEQAAVPGAGRRLRQADGHQQRRDPGQRPRDPPNRRRRPMPGSAPRTRPAPRLFCLSGCVTPAGRVRGAVRRHAPASCSRWPAALPAAGRCRPSCSAARPGCSCARTSSTCR